MQRKKVLVIGESVTLRASMAAAWNDHELYFASSVRDWLRYGGSIIPDIIVNGSAVKHTAHEE